jgi:hypothetical protein
MLFSMKPPRPCVSQEAQSRLSLEKLCPAHRCILRGGREFCSLIGRVHWIRTGLQLLSWVEESDIWRGKFRRSSRAGVAHKGCLSLVAACMRAHSLRGRDAGCWEKKSKPALFHPSASSPTPIFSLLHPIFFTQISSYARMQCFELLVVLSYLAFLFMCISFCPCLWKLVTFEFWFTMISDQHMKI